MAIALVQSKVSTIVGSGTTATATFDSDVTAGNLLVAIVENVDGESGDVSIADNQSGGGNVWAPVVAVLNSTTSTEVSIWCCNAKESAACAVTATSAIATIGGIVCRVLEYSGAATSSPIGATGSAGPTTSTNPTVNLSSVVAGSLVIGSTNSTGQQATPGAGYTGILGTGDSFYFDRNEHDLDAAAGTVAVDFSNDSSVWVVAAAEFFSATAPITRGRGRAVL